ncbi:MAG: hypothetical protein ACXU8U_04970 [Asticcacaulis sp.]
MTAPIYRLIDSNTGEEVTASEGFSFYAIPTPEHRIHDAALMARYGGPAVVDRVEEVKAPDGTPQFDIYIDGGQEQMNANVENDENYRPQETN